MKVVIAWALGAVLVGSCGTKPALSIAIKLPDGLSKGTARYDRFIRRVVHLRVKLETAEGAREEVIVPPQDWERLGLPSVQFPRNEQDTLEIQAEIWDRNLEGESRSYAVAQGQGRIKASEVNFEGQIVNVVIPMSLKVSLREFDY